ncbi:hypothetical protein GCM10009624_33060 [Gordonia sinesedis]
MSSDDGSDRPHGDGSASATGGGASNGFAAGSIPDPLRDLLLGLAAQIDQVASWFAPGAPRQSGAARQPGGTRQPGAATSGSAGGPGELAAEITTLLAEIGDLLARLIAALIAILEAIAAALRAAPAEPAEPPTHYQSIAVRIDADAAAPGVPIHRRPEPEGEK